MTDKIRQGIIEHQVLPRFITKSNTGIINLNAEKSPTLVSFAHGKTDYLLIEDISIDGAWAGPFVLGTNYWLYWDIDIETSQRTFGQTAIEPNFGKIRTPAPVLDQHYFDLNENKMFVWDGNKWVEKIRVFSGTLDEQLVLNPKGNYSQINVYGEFDSDTILIDRFNKPVVKFVDNGTSEFVTDRTNTVNESFNLSTFTYGKLTPYYGLASENIPKHHCIIWDVNRQIKLASFNDIENPSFGISENELSVGEVGKILTNGFVKNRNDWSWVEKENTFIFVGENGEIVTNVPQIGSSQRIGYIVSPNTIFLHFSEQIIIDPTPIPSITPSPTPSVTPTPEVSVTPSVSVSVTPSITVTPSASVSITPSITTSVTPTASVSVTPPTSPTPTPSSSAGVGPYDGGPYF